MTTFVKICVFYILLLIVIIKGYFYRVISNDEVDRTDFCSDMLNCDDEPHVMCFKENSSTSNENECENKRKFKILPFSRKEVVYSHNGLRDRFAHMYKISNMNLLHYDEDLEEMARKYVRKCKFFENSKCKFILNGSYPVGQNREYMYSIPPKNYIKKVIRDWYLERDGRVNYVNFKYLDSESAMNLTQLVWPLTQFVGCGAAKYYNSYFVVCIYWPAIEPFMQPFKFGERCSHCPSNRKSCSIIFKNLCGLDEFNEKLSDSSLNTKNTEAMHILVFVALTFLLLICV